jgi:hypothetical protein
MTQQLPVPFVGVLGDTLSSIKTHFVPLIEDDDLRGLVGEAAEALKQTIIVFGDEVEPDTEQVRAIWLKFVNQHISAIVFDKVSEQLAKIENENLRVPMSALLVPCVEMIRILTDEEADNKAQIDKLWDDFISSPETHSAFLDYLFKQILVKLIKNEATVDLLIGTIKQILQMYLEKTGFFNRK